MKKQHLIGLGVVVVAVVVGVLVYQGQQTSPAPPATATSTTVPAERTTPSGNPPSSELITVTMGYRPISPSLDLFVALEKDYFEDEGLDLKLEVFRGSSDLTDAVIAGKVDFASDLGMVTQLLPIMRSNQYSVRFLSLNLDALDSPMRGPTLIAKKDTGIQDFTVLKEKTVGIFPGINFKIFLEATLKKHGMKLDDVNSMEIPPQEQMTGFASVDALLSLDPITSGLQFKQGAVLLGDRLAARYIFDNFPAAATSVNAKYGEANPEVVEKMIKIVDMSIDYIRRGESDIAEILSKHTKLPLEITKTMKPVKYAKYGEIDVENLQKTCDYLRDIPWLNLERTLDAKKLVWKSGDGSGKK